MGLSHSTLNNKVATSGNVLLGRMLQQKLVLHYIDDKIEAIQECITHTNQYAHIDNMIGDTSEQEIELALCLELREQMQRAMTVLLYDYKQNTKGGVQ